MKIKDKYNIKNQKMDLSDSRGGVDETLTFIQVICAFAVITLHVNGQFWNFSSTERYWLTANIIESLFYFAVPVFFMITGITLINYQDRYSINEYFKKRISKTFFPYIIWSFIGIIYLYVRGSINIESITLKYIISGLLNGNIIGIYWFFPELFCIYLSLPLFAAVDKNKRKWVFEYLFVTAFIINILIPFIINVFEINIRWSYSVGSIAGYLIWIIAGVLLYYYPPGKNIKFIIVFLGIIGVLIHIIGTYRLSIAANSIVQTYKGYNNLPCFFYSLAVFIMLTEISNKVMKVQIINKLINFLGKYTFEFYLIHWYVMGILGSILDIDTRSIVWRLGAPIIMEIIVIIITYILRCIPFVNKIVP